MYNPFFKNTGPYDINKLLKLINLNSKKYPEVIIQDVKDLHSSSEKDLTFFHSKKYITDANKTKASFCITTNSLSTDLPNKVEKILVKNVLYELTKLLKKIIIGADVDYPDLTLNPPVKKKFISVKFGNNVLIGKNVKIGKN